MRPLYSIALFAATSAAAQTATPSRAIPIRSLTVTATSSATWRAPRVRSLGTDAILIEDVRRIVVVDTAFANVRVLADTSGFSPFPWRGEKIIQYLGDSLLITDLPSGSLIVIDPSGKPGRTMAMPSAASVGPIVSTGLVATDGRARLVFQGPRPFTVPQPCIPGAATEIPPARIPAIDSLPIVRADFETRRIDTIAYVRQANNSFAPQVLKDANCKAVSATLFVDPSMPVVDSWVTTSDGLVAIVRGHDYHIDWIDPDGRVRSTPKMAFDWRRVTDDEKQAKRDSARAIIDSMTNAGGYRLQVCPNSYALYTRPPPPGVKLSDGPAGRGGRGDGGVERPIDLCQLVSVTPRYAQLGEMPDYLPPVRDYSALADRDGNVWILPTTSAAARGGLLYDVVNSRGEIAYRVQLPAERYIAGFGRGGVVYLNHRAPTGGIILERAAIAR